MKKNEKGSSSMEYGAGSGLGRLEKAGISTSDKQKKKKNRGSKGYK